MKILFILHNPNNPFSGAVRVYHVLADILRSDGHVVELMHLEDCGLPRTKTLNLAAQRLGLPTLVSRAAARRDFTDVDVVMSSSGMAAPLFRSLRKRPKRPVLINHLHGLVKYDHVANLSEAELGHWKVTMSYRLATGPFQVRWDQAGIDAADHTVVQNLRDLSSVRDTLQGRSGVTFIPPCVHPDLLASSASINPIGHRQAGKIMSFGTWESRKGSYYMPAAFRLIRQSFPDATLTLGGTGRPAAFIRPFFDERDRDAVTIMPFLSNEEHSALMNEQAIVLFPSLSEGFGLALVEALCFGVAGVTTATGFGADFLVDDASAKIVFPSADHIARAVIDLIRHETLRHCVATSGRAIARTFTPQRMAQSYEQLFHTLIDQRIPDMAGE